ncbi:hypothetical protein ABZ260_27055 [Streptosporangium sp. NPDC006013]|uniref:hypothetical protein n=1 Tax=Streptosporangium sp. NPDC006013 TaxID=3155596 RepID=UPI0033B1FAEC
MTVVLDPGQFRCSALVAELADEWGDYLALNQGTCTAAYVYRQAIRCFATYVDERCEAPHVVSLAKDSPDPASLLREWMRHLPAGYPPGSVVPSRLAWHMRTLIRLRGERDETLLTDGLRRLLLAPTRVREGTTKELDEFSRSEKQAMIRAAWADVRALEERLARGQKMIEAAQGHPDQHGWLNPANLLWALAEGQMSFAELERLPSLKEWPQELREVAEWRGIRLVPAWCRYQLAVSLAGLLYLRAGDLQAFRLLLGAATGHSPEEITGLRVGDVEFTPSGVRLTLVKSRAHTVRHRLFSDHEIFADSRSGGPNAAEVIRRLLAVTQRARADSGLDPLFLRVSIAPGWKVRFASYDSNTRDLGFGNWVDSRGLDISKPRDLRRMRKSVKVEKAIAMRGVVSDIADDHTPETFLGHYAHGTTLHVISGRVVNNAQRAWLETALSGPTVVGEDAVADLAEPDARAFLGLSRDQAEQLIAGALDMGVTDCRDPLDSPYSKKGEVCAVAPLRCLECRNAFILPSNLPQLLLFADHLERLSHRLAPQHFHLLWGQSRTNLNAVLSERTAVEITAARRQIEEQRLSLQLPLAAHTEFDR